MGGAIPDPGATALGSGLLIPINLSWVVMFSVRVERRLLLTESGRLRDGE